MAKNLSSLALLEAEIFLFEKVLFLLDSSLNLDHVFQVPKIYFSWLFCP
jgi:TRAP-type mannitol/chloroaromatic compound transport system permease small subunit